MGDNYHNVGLGMVPHKKGCRCEECEIVRLRDRVADLERRLAESMNRRCDDCGATVSDHRNGCPTCGAPVCCQQCCKIAYYKARAQAAEAECDRLLEGNTALAAWLCPFTDGKTGLVNDPYGNQYCAKHRFERAVMGLYRWKSEDVDDLFIRSCGPRGISDWIKADEIEAAHREHLGDKP